MLSGGAPLGSPLEVQPCRPAPPVTGHLPLDLPRGALPRLSPVEPKVGDLGPPRTPLHVAVRDEHPGAGSPVQCPWGLWAVGCAVHGSGCWSLLTSTSAPCCFGGSWTLACTRGMRPGGPLTHGDLGLDPPHCWWFFSLVCPHTCWSVPMLPPCPRACGCRPGSCMTHSFRDLPPTFPLAALGRQVWGSGWGDLPFLTQMYQAGGLGGKVVPEAHC